MGKQSTASPRAPTPPPPSPLLLPSPLLVRVPRGSGARGERKLHEHFACFLYENIPHRRKKTACTISSQGKLYALSRYRSGVQIHRCLAANVAQTSGNTPFFSFRVGKRLASSPGKGQVGKRKPQRNNISWWTCSNDAPLVFGGIAFCVRMPT